MSARLGMKRSAVRGGVLVLEHGDVVVLTYNDDDDDPWIDVDVLRWLLRTGDCGGFANDDDNAVRVPRDFLGDKGAPRSEIMLLIGLLLLC